MSLESRRSAFLPVGDDLLDPVGRVGHEPDLRVALAANEGVWAPSLAGLEGVVRPLPHLVCVQEDA